MQQIEEPWKDFTRGILKSPSTTQAEGDDGHDDLPVKVRRAERKEDVEAHVEALKSGETAVDDETEFAHDNLRKSICVEPKPSLPSFDSMFTLHVEAGNAGWMSVMHGYVASLLMMN